MATHLRDLTVALNHTRRQLAYLQRKGIPENLLANLRAREATLHRAVLRSAALTLCAATTPGDC
ncbi:MAG: hypothetical protein ACI8RZ_008008 [Myxococcota bacterium]|jgi:hypothetical protein